MVSSSKTAAEAWNRLTKYYANSSSSRVMGLTDQLSQERGTRSIAEYLGCIRGIADQLAIIGAQVSNSNLILHALNGVGSEFDKLAAAIRAQDTVIGFEELHDKLVEYESFLKRKERNPAVITANAARFNQQRLGNQTQRKNSQNPTNPGNQRNQGGQRYDNTNNNQGNNFNKGSAVICQYCDNTGHNARQCYSLKRKLGLPVPPRANHTTMGGGGRDSSSNWLLDTGASHHVTANLNNLSIQQPYEGPDDIVIGDGTGLPITHIGTSTLTTPTNSFSLSNV
ncbi:hypothetical protein Vadar_000503 [Vaccinium darrowii]|uniref:Uncharacterized protein n=1 Tax=Vaccinium darrowii TaxID=229202 RepID=A0ACB7X732_9ERIC|nr:hypothetical protein Vadar_000503 [Vaccinium darrowii]